MGPDQPSAILARQLYPRCNAHFGAASEVLEHLQNLLHRNLTEADYDTTLADLLGFVGRGLPALLPKREVEMLAIVETAVAAGRGLCGPQHHRRRSGTLGTLISLEWSKSAALRS